MQPLGAGEIEKGFVDRQRLDQRRQRLHQRCAPRARPWHISPCSGRTTLGVRAEPQRLEHRHRRAHAIGAGDVAGGRPPRRACRRRRSPARSASEGRRAFRSWRRRRRNRRARWRASRARHDAAAAASRRPGNASPRPGIGEAIAAEAGHGGLTLSVPISRSQLAAARAAPARCSAGSRPALSAKARGVSRRRAYGRARRRESPARAPPRGWRPARSRSRQGSAPSCSGSSAMKLSA